MRTTQEKLEYVDFLFHKSGKAYEKRDVIFSLLFDLLKEEVVEAASMLAEAYNTEQVTEYDFERSYGYSRLAKDFNDPEGLYYWATDPNYYEDREFRRKLLIKSADMGFPRACHDYGKDIFSKEPEKAIKYLETSINDNDRIHLVDYAIALSILNRDLETAFECIKKTYENDKYKIAILALAYFYDNGIGVKQDILKACKLYNEDHHFWTSDVSKGLLAVRVIQNKSGLDISDSDAFKMLLESSKKTYVPYQVFVALSICYKNGIGVEIDLEKAEEYKNKAKEIFPKMKDLYYLSNILL